MNIQTGQGVRVEKVVALYSGQGPHFSIGLNTPDSIYRDLTGKFAFHIVQEGIFSLLERLAHARGRQPTEDIRKFSTQFIGCFIYMSYL